MQRETIFKVFYQLYSTKNTRIHTHKTREPIFSLTRIIKISNIHHPEKQDCAEQPKKEILKVWKTLLAKKLQKIKKASIDRLKSFSKKFSQCLKTYRSFPQLLKTTISPIKPKITKQSSFKPVKRFSITEISKKCVNKIFGK